MPDRPGIAREINTLWVSAVLRDGVSESFVLLQADNSHRIAIPQQGLAEHKIVLERPGAYGQEAAAGINQHQRLALHRRVIRMKRLSGPLQFLCWKSHQGWWRRKGGGRALA